MSWCTCTVDTVDRYMWRKGGDGGGEGVGREIEGESLEGKGKKYICGQATVCPYKNFNAIVSLKVYLIRIFMHEYSLSVVKENARQ